MVHSLKSFTSSSAQRKLHKVAFLLGKLGQQTRCATQISKVK